MASGLETLTLAPEPGERVVLDRLPGAAPAYVFLHGLGSVRAGEKGNALLAHARTRGRGFLRFDFRGHGQSSGRIGYTTIGELVRDAIAVLDLAGPAILVGSSLGGLVAALVAAQQPERVAGLVLLAPALGFLHRMERRLDATGHLRTSEGLSFPVHPRVLADAAALDEPGLPGRIRATTLLVHGADDVVVPPALSRRFFADLAPGRHQFWLVPGGDHRLNREIGAILQRMDDLLG